MDFVTYPHSKYMWWVYHYKLEMQYHELLCINTKTIKFSPVKREPHWREEIISVISYRHNWPQRSCLLGAMLPHSVGSQESPHYSHPSVLRQWAPPSQTYMHTQPHTCTHTHRATGFPINHNQIQTNYLEEPSFPSLFHSDKATRKIKPFHDISPSYTHLPWILLMKHIENLYDC